MIIDMNKKYETRNGLDVTLLVDNMKGTYPVGSIVHEDGQDDNITNWTREGKFMADGDDDRDLVEVKKKHTLTRWVNIYCKHTPTTHITRVLADEYGKNLAIGGDKRIACKPIAIEYEDGEGLGEE